MSHPRLILERRERRPLLAALLGAMAIGAAPPLFAQPTATQSAQSAESAESAETRSCRAAKLGRDADRRELRSLERDVPFYVLRAANGNPKTALGRWMETLRWRCEIGDEAIVSKPNPNFFKIHRDYPTYLHLPDQAGRLTYWQMAGQLNPAGLSEQGMTPDLVRDDYVPFEKQVWQTLFTYDLWLQRDGEQEITIIIDMEGFQLSSVTPSMLQIFSKSYSVIQKHFPDREHLVVVINAPEWWGAIWQLFKPLIPQRQREKLRVHTTPFNSEDLLDVIDAKNIPEKYGGSSVPLGEAPAELKRRKFAAEGAA